MKTAQGTRAKTAGNCQNPGDFGTNGTRGVVLSGMSETTKRTLGADMIDLSVPWADRIDRTHLAARPVDQQALRASTLGGVKRETTNSPAEIGGVCAGRKTALNLVEVIPLSLYPLAVASVAACLILSHGSALSVLCGPALVAFCALVAVLWKMARGVR